MPTIRAVFTLRRHLRAWSWIALFAIFGIAVAPTVSHALAAEHGDPGSGWAEICTPQGTRLVPLVDGAVAVQSLAPDLGGMHMEHCPLCSLSGAPLAMPPAPLCVLPPAGLSQAVPALFLQAPRPLFAWAAPQPRGPPAVRA